MGFLDSLEDNLKSLESHGEKGAGEQQERERREAERARALAAAPNADRLKNGPYTAELLRQATRIGHGLRVKVNLAWLGSTLRLEARERRLELRPTAEGVTAVFLENGAEVRSFPVDLEGDPADLARQWLAGA